jgi:hypothetical protein
MTTTIEAMQVGHRYLETIDPTYDHLWIVASVERHEAKVEVLRNGEWVTPELVTVTYASGQSITHEVGTEIAIDCDR